MAKDPLDALFAEPPRTFIAARNALAAQLKKQGDAEGAARVKGLGKPTLPLWAVNQAARQNPADVRALLDVSAALKDAQLALTKGKPSDFRELSDRHREVVRKVRADLARALEVAPTARSANLDRAEATLLAAASGSEEQRAALGEGRLTEELSAAGFDVFGGAAFTAAAASSKRPAAAKKAAEPKPATHHPQRASAVGRRHGAADKKHSAAEEKHAAADMKRDAAEKEAAAEQKRAAAEEKARRLAALAAEAKSSADRLAREEAAAKAEVEQAEAARDRAKAALAEAKQALAAAETQLQVRQEELRAAAQRAKTAARQAAAAERRR